VAQPGGTAGAIEIARGPGSKASSKEPVRRGAKTEATEDDGEADGADVEADGARSVIFLRTRAKEAAGRSFRLLTSS
jgi:hypothetical protein